MKLSDYIFMYKWCRANWHYLKHGIILHKKGVKLNAPFLSTKQPIYFLFIIFMITSCLPPSFAAHFCTLYKTEKYLCNSSWYIVAVSSWMACFSSCILCVCVGDPCIHNLSNIPCRKKTRTMRSGNSTVHGIPNTWNRCLLFMNALNNPLIHCHWEGFDAISSLACSLWPRPSHRRPKVHSEMCQLALCHTVWDWFIFDNVEFIFHLQVLFD